jgi:hypothetical protein
MEHQPLNPRGASVAIDANALKRVDPARSAMVHRLLALADAREFRLIVPHGVRGELQHPHTPSEESGPVLGALFTIRTGLASHEQQQLRALKDAMRGSALPRHARG